MIRRTNLADNSVIRKDKLVFNRRVSKKRNYFSSVDMFVHGWVGREYLEECWGVSKREEKVSMLRSSCHNRSEIG